MGEFMKKFIFSLVAILMLSSIASALMLEDLNVPDKTTVEDYLIDNFESITQINIEEMEGEEYEIFVVGDDYIIIIHKGIIYVVAKD